MEEILRVLHYILDCRRLGEQAISWNGEEEKLEADPLLFLLILGSFLGWGTFLLGWCDCTLTLGLGSTWILGLRLTGLLALDRGWLTRLFHLLLLGLLRVALLLLLLLGRHRYEEYQVSLKNETKQDMRHHERDPSFSTPF